MSSSTNPTFAYWDIRGLAEPVRMLLTYTNTTYEDKRYVCGDGPEFDKSCWLDIKDSLGLSFPNLPYYIDGEVKISQSNAILRYIATKNNFIGKTALEQARCLEMQDVLMDFRNSMVGLFYNSEFEAKKETYLTKTLPAKLQSFEKLFQTTNEPFTCGSSLTFVDFVLYELLDQNRIFEPTSLDTYPKLKEFLTRIEALPELSDFLKSEKHLKTPINNKMAFFK